MQLERIQGLGTSAKGTGAETQLASGGGSLPPSGPGVVPGRRRVAAGTSNDKEDGRSISLPLPGARTRTPASGRRQAAAATGADDGAPAPEINVDDIGPEHVARMMKRRMLYLIPTSPTGNDMSCLMKVVQVLPGWREGFVVSKPRSGPDADIDVMTLEQASAEVQRLLRIAGDVQA